MVSILKGGNFVWERRFDYQISKVGCIVIEDLNIFVQFKGGFYFSFDARVISGFWDLSTSTYLRHVALNLNLISQDYKRLLVDIAW